jgi:hypothetical protein
MECQTKERTSDLPTVVGCGRGQLPPSLGSVVGAQEGGSHGFWPSCLLAFLCGFLESFHTWLVMPNIQNVPVQKEVRQPGQGRHKLPATERRCHGQEHTATVSLCAQSSRAEEGCNHAALVQTIKRFTGSTLSLLFLSDACPARVRAARGEARRFRRYVLTWFSGRRRFQGRILNLRQAELRGKRSPIVGSWKTRRIHAGEVPFMHGTDGHSLYII